MAILLGILTQHFQVQTLISTDKSTAAMGISVQDWDGLPGILAE